MLIDPSLIKAVRSQHARRFFSAQTRQQIEIGLKIIDFTKEELSDGKTPIEVLVYLIKQCVERDDGWKDFYVEEMNKLSLDTKSDSIVEMFIAEKSAEELYASGNVSGACSSLQKYIDKAGLTGEEKGWYLQEMARYEYIRSHIDSNKLQISAHRNNNRLLKPKNGMVIEKLSPSGQRRIEAVKKWISDAKTNEELSLRVNDILDAMQFGVLADRFEGAVHNLGIALGFTSQRPDKQWKAGPDNLWCTRDNEYLLIECKNEVNISRREIYKDETGQMNNACAWFSENYPGCKPVCIMIIPGRELANGAGFNCVVKVIRKSNLEKLRRNVRRFFDEFSKADLADLSEALIDTALRSHSLTVEDLVQEYSEAVRSHIN